MMEEIKARLNFFFQESDEEPIYDPLHIAALIVISLSVMGALFWLLWTLLVFGGGIFKKIVPAFQVLLTSKKLEDFGWVGYPYELGVFEGFLANSIALILTIALVWAIGWLLKKKEIFK